MCAQKISSIVWGWMLSTSFVYRTNCFCEVVCSGKSPNPWEAWPWTGSGLRVAWSMGRKGLQRNRSLGRLLELPQRAKLQPYLIILFYFKNWICSEVLNFSFLLAVGTDIFCFTVHIPCQLTSVHFHMCCSDFEAFLGFVFIILPARSIMHVTVQGLICSFVPNQLAHGAWSAQGEHSPLRGHETFLLRWSRHCGPVTENTLCLACGVDASC